MDINRPPQILSIKPKNYETNVSTDLTKITLSFSIDLDPSTIDGNVRLQNQSGNTILTSLEYGYRVVTVHIREALSPNTTYQLSVFGDASLEDTDATGIRSALQVPMEGSATIYFTTIANLSILPPTGTYPSDGAVVKEAPAFNWEIVDNASRYELEISKSNSMTPAYWRSENILEPSVYVDIPLEDGVYYWRIRSIDNKGNPSNWSNTYIFHLDTINESPIVPEDSISPEIGYTPLEDIDDGYVEIIDTFPKEDYSNVSTKLQTISVTILGDVTESDISIEMFGESVLGDGEDHGNVSGTITTEPQSDGTTIVTFTPNPIEVIETE
jgi:hypothetical protein